MPAGIANIGDELMDCISTAWGGGLRGIAVLLTLGLHVAVHDLEAPDRKPSALDAQPKVPHNQQIKSYIAGSPITLCKEVEIKPESRILWLAVPDF